MPTSSLRFDTFLPLRNALVVGATAVALLVLCLPAEAANHNVTVSNFQFDPPTLTIEVGDSVTWTNAGGAHNVRADDNSFRCANGCDDTGGNGAIAANAWSFTRTFNSVAEIPYFCVQHGTAGGGGMSATLSVVAGGNPGALRFSTTSTTINEGNGQASITVQRVNGDDGAVSVQYSTSNGSATAGSDYTARSGTLNWADNDDDNKSFTVPIIDDNEQESNESINLTLSSPGGGASLGTPSTASITISDNDQGGGGSPGNLAFSGASYQASEGAGTASIVVNRSGGTDGAVSVNYATSDGSATAGSDYTATSGTLNWGDGDGADKSFDVPILEDVQGESDETVDLSLSGPGGGASLGSPNAAVLTLFDNDSVEPGPCVADANTICLQDDRFRVRVTFTPPGGVSQPANAVPFTDRAGTFWFFNENNIEMLLKVLDACVAPFNRYWVFFSATTNVEFTVTVDDTEALQQNVYRNPQGMVALPEADTQAFDTCP